MNIRVENISGADEKYLKEFYYETNNLPAEFTELICRNNIKIVLADKYTDTADNEAIDELKNKYSEHTDSDTDNIDKTIRGRCTDATEEGTLTVFIFYNTTSNIIGAILYHEIGHLIDFHQNIDTPSYSTDERFVTAYKKDLKRHWNKIKEDKRYRLIHYIQNSTPENPSIIAMAETFAHCVARNYNKIDDIDIVNEYFQNCLKITKILINEFFITYLQDKK